MSLFTDLDDIFFSGKPMGNADIFWSSESDFEGQHEDLLGSTWWTSPERREIILKEVLKDPNSKKSFDWAWSTKLHEMIVSALKENWSRGAD